MRRILFIVLAAFVIIVAFSIYNENFTENDDELDGEIIVENGPTMSGYYYYGYLDQREKMNAEEEQEYFYYMDNHFHEYQDSFYLFSSNNEELDEDIENYFESIGRLYLFSIPDPGSDVKDGDYITFTVKSPIKESYPAIIDKIDDVEVLHPRETE